MNTKSKRMKINGRKQTVELIREGKIPEGAIQIMVDANVSELSNEECFVIIQKQRGFETKSVNEEVSEHPERIYFLIKD